MFLIRTQHSDVSEARTAAPRSRVKHSTTEPLHSPFQLCDIGKKYRPRPGAAKCVDTICLLNVLHVLTFE